MSRRDYIWCLDNWYKVIKAPSPKHYVDFTFKKMICYNYLFFNAVWIENVHVRCQHPHPQTTPHEKWWIIT